MFRIVALLEDEPPACFPKRTEREATRFMLDVNQEFQFLITPTETLTDLSVS